MMTNKLDFFIEIFLHVSGTASFFRKILVDFPQVEDVLVLVAAASVFDLG